MNEQGKTTQQLLEKLSYFQQRVTESEIFRSLFLEASVGTVVATPSGQITQVNQAFCDFLGYSESEFIGKTILSITHPADREASSTVFRQAVESVAPIQRFEKRYLHKNGQTRWGEISSTLIHDAEGKPDYFFAQVLDITERKQAEEALQKAHDELEKRVKERTAELMAANKALQESKEVLRQSHDELQAIYNGMVEGLLVTDVKTLRFLRVNASLCRMLGYSEEELLSLSMEDIHPAEAIPDILEHMPNALKNTDSANEINHVHPGTMPFLRKDGSVFYTEVIGKSLIYDGKLCAMGIFRDITERLQAEAALEQERQSLWKMLQASDHERQTISYDIHDGLAQYLAAAGMGFQTYDSIKENAPNEARKAYETAVELVRQAHGEARRLIGEVRHPVIDERGLATAIVSLAYEQQRRGGPKIGYHTNVEFNRLPPILENALYRMAQEALTNACKHSKSKKVTVSMIQEGQDVRLEIQDWGTGFDTEATEKGHFGLESIRQRVRLLGGRLTIESSPNSGTLVQIVVPILEKQANH